MTREEAKTILAAYRPGVDDRDDPIFAPAFKAAENDPELKSWLAHSIEFDASVRADLAQLTVPESLRRAILAQAPGIRPSTWWHRKLAPVELAAAAVILITLTLTGMWFAQRPGKFAPFQREIVDRTWGAHPHVELGTTNLIRVRQFFASHGAATDFDVPPALAKSISGCSFADWRGRRIPFLCFTSGGQHFHMVVVERDLFPDAPSRMPEVDRWDVWRTASWSKGPNTYVITGLTPSAFLKKFRKNKRWDWEG